MSYLEGSFNRNRLQAVGYRDPERSPFVITHQTDQFLGLINLGLGIKDARDYMHEFTLPYLETAAKAGRVLYDDKMLSGRFFDPEDEEAARHAFIVMAWMHQLTKSSYLPMGFSRNGMLRAPLTYREYQQRIREVKLQLGIVSSDYDHNRMPLESNPPRLRTKSFFSTASKLLINFPPTTRESARQERENLNDLLKGIEGLEP